MFFSFFLQVSTYSDSVVVVHCSGRIGLEACMEISILQGCKLELNTIQNKQRLIITVGGGKRNASPKYALAWAQHTDSL